MEIAIPQGLKPRFIYRVDVRAEQAAEKLGISSEIEMSLRG
jgi:hypothetical protein